MRRVVIVVIVAALAGLFGWRTLEVIRTRQAQAVPSGPGQSRAVPVEVTPAGRGQIAARGTFTGEVTANTRVEVYPRIAGVVAAIEVREGEEVRRGQILVRLDPKELRFQVEQARAAANTQRVQVEQARVTLATQQARLAQVLAGAADEQIRQAEEQVRQTRASLDYSRQQLRRAEDLYTQGFISGQAVEAARLDVVQQETRLRSAEEQLALLRRGARPEEVDIARKQVLQAEVALRQAQSQFAQVQVTLRQAQNLLAESAIRAPAAGTVGRRLVDAGATVTPAIPLVQLVHLDPVLVTFPVAERETAAIRPGMPAVVRADAAPGETFQGSVAAVSPLLAPATRTAEVRVAVPNPARRLRPGMTARVELVLAHRVDVVALPVDAVLEQDGKKVVFVVREGLAQAREVETGISDGVRVEIRRGIIVGDLVVIAGQHNLRDGAPVIVPGRGNDAGPPGAPGGNPGRRGSGPRPGASPTPGGQGP